MENFKSTIINWILWPLITATAWAAGLPQLLLSALTSQASAPVAYSVQQGPEELWWTVTKALVPICIGVAAFVGVSFGVRKLWPARSKGENSPDWFSRWVAMSQQTAAQKPVEDAPPAVHWLKPKEALNASTDRKWVLGQAIPQQPNRENSRRAVGQLFTVDYQTTQFAILGGSGGGKTTSTGFMLLLYCKMFGLHPIVLDAKNGLDWASFGEEDILEWHQLIPTNLLHYLKQLWAIYEERHAILRAAKASKIYDLPASKRPEPLFVFLEEFGLTWEESGFDKEIGWYFNKLSSLGRAVGIIICPIDQAPQNWTKPMRGNAKVAVCYPAQGGVLKAFDEHFTSEMPQTGVFSRGNVFYRSWYFGKMQELHHLPKIQRRYLALPEANATNERRTNDEPAEFVLPEANDERTNEPQFATPVVLPPSVVRSFAGSNWDKAAKAYFNVYDEASHIDWVRAMATLANDGRPYTAFKGGLSMRLFNAYSPKGDKTKV